MREKERKIARLLYCSLIFLFSQKLTLSLSLGAWPKWLGGVFWFYFIFLFSCLAPISNDTINAHHLLSLFIVLAIKSCLPLKLAQNFGSKNSLLFLSLAGHFEVYLASLRSQPSFSRKLSPCPTKWVHIGPSLVLSQLNQFA